MASPSPPADDADAGPGGSFLSALTDRSTSRNFLGFLVGFIAWSVVSAIVLDVLVPNDGKDAIADVAGPLIPALGALFAFLAAFAINTEWREFREAQRAVDLEADAAGRFGLIAESPGLDHLNLRRLLAGYLDQVVTDEWPRLREGRGSQDARDALAALFRETRRTVTAPGVGPVTGIDLIGAVDAMVALRRDRLSVARRSIPSALLLLAFASGVVLCLDAVLVALPHERWVSIAIGGLVVITALALALVVSVSAPFRGTITVDPRPLATVLDEVNRSDLDPIGPP